MTDRDKLLALAERVAALAKPDQGLHYKAANYGKRRYDPLTGEPYFTRSEPDTLTVYSESARFLYWLIENAGSVAESLRALAQEAGK